MMKNTGKDFSLNRLSAHMNNQKIIKAAWLWSTFNFSKDLKTIRMHLPFSNLKLLRLVGLVHNKFKKRDVRRWWKSGEIGNEAYQKTINSRF